jgi:hypothetical protein
VSCSSHTCRCSAQLTCCGRCRAPELCLAGCPQAVYAALGAAVSSSREEWRVRRGSGRTAHCRACGGACTAVGVCARATLFITLQDGNLQLQWLDKTGRQLWQAVFDAREEFCGYATRALKVLRAERAWAEGGPSAAPLESLPSSAAEAEAEPPQLDETSRAAKPSAEQPGGSSGGSAAGSGGVARAPGRLATSPRAPGRSSGNGAGHDALAPATRGRVQGGSDAAAGASSSAGGPAGAAAAPARAAGPPGGLGTALVCGHAGVAQPLRVLLRAEYLPRAVDGHSVALSEGTLGAAAGLRGAQHPLRAALRTQPPAPLVLAPIPTAKPAPPDGLAADGRPLVPNRKDKASQ